MSEQTFKIEEEKGQRPLTYWWQTTSQPSADDPPTCTIKPPQPGDLCPACGQGRLDYDSLFLLTCPICHTVAAGGAFT